MQYSESMHVDSILLVERKMTLASFTTKQNQHLLPVNFIVLQCEHQCGDGDDVEDGISKNGVLVDLGVLHATQVDGKTTYRGHKDEVKDSRSENGRRSNVILGDENTNQGDKQFRCRSAQCHECGAGNVSGEIENISNVFNGGEEIKVTDDS